jgi:hypothetical protein
MPQTVKLSTLSVSSDTARKLIRYVSNYDIKCSWEPSDEVNPPRYFLFSGSKRTIELLAAFVAGVVSTKES